MAINRAQLEQQIQSLSNGGGIAPMDDDLQSVVDQAAAVDTNELRSQFGMPSKEQELLEEMQRKFAPAPRQSIGIDMPDFDESFSKYQTQLRNVYGQRSRPNFYDLASTVGGAMLAADPTAGAFRSAGMGLAQFGKEQAALREQRLQEDRAIGLKAFEMAKSDVDSARNLINEYALLRAKENADNKVTEMLVTNPEGIVVSGVFYESGSRPLLTESEIFANRSNLADVAAPSTGWKVPDAGAIAIYQSRADAEKTIEGLGLTRESPYFESAVQQLIPSDSSLIGKRVISGGKYTELRPLVQGDKVVNVMLNTATGETTNFSDYSKKRLEIIAKNNSTYVDKALTLLPEVERALMILKGGAETGKVTEITFELKKLFTDVFSIDDPSISDIESLIGISNILATKIRPVGSGSTSDMEFRAYRQAILDLGKSPEANYIALYVYKKMTENSITYNRSEEEALTSGDYINSKQVNDSIKQIDTGIFEKFTGDSSDNQAIESWMKSLPDGSVFINRDAQGKVLVEGEPVYIIKGFK
jgi:hypothetical protein